MTVRGNSHKEVFPMTKEAYERTEIEIIAFTVDDVLTTSGGEPLDEYEVDPIK